LLSAQRKPILTGLDWLRSETFGPFQQIANASRMIEASGLRDKRDQPTGTHGGLPKGDVAQTANGPASRCGRRFNFGYLMCVR
jgi:hypothetical protein